MELTDIKDKFIEFCGDEKYRKFIDKLRRISENEYDLRFIHEKRLNDFCEYQNNIITPDIVLSTLSDGTEYIYHCPTSTCSYIAICIDHDSDIWGCGECGYEWNSRYELFEDIESSIKVHPYRSDLYVKNSQGYLPNNPKYYPNNLHELIEREWNSS